jgi:hypothetical protein
LPDHPPMKEGRRNANQHASNHENLFATSMGRIDSGLYISRHIASA